MNLTDAGNDRCRISFSRRRAITLLFGWLVILAMSNAAAPAQEGHTVSIKTQNAVLGPFWREMNGPNVKTLGDELRFSYQFGREHGPKILDIVLTDLAEKDSPVVAAKDDPHVIRGQRYGGLVCAQMYGPQAKRALTILEWWKAHGNERQKMSATEWLKMHERMRFVQHGADFELKYRIWPNMEIEARDLNEGMKEYLKLVNAQIPSRSLFQKKPCMAYRIDRPTGSEKKSQLIRGYRILSGPVNVPADLTKVVSDQICDPRHLGSRTACMFEPGLLLRFPSRTSIVDVPICFKCGDLVILQNGKYLERSQVRFSPTLRRNFLTIGQQVAPHDTVWKQIETQLNE